MNLERLLQILVAALSVLGAGLLGLEQRQAVLPLLVLFAAVTSVCFTDTLQWFRLNRLVVNVAALAAMLFSMSEFLGAADDSQDKLRAIANLLVCWQVVMLYQEKNQGVYALLLMLSLLEMIIGAVLNVGILFGVLLSVYVVLGLLAMVLFFIYQTTQRFQDSRSGRPSKLGIRPGHPGPTTGSPANSTDEQPAWSHLLGAAPVAYRESTVAVAQQLPGGPLGRQTAGLIFATFIFAIVFFWSAPRERHTTWNKGQLGRTSTVGFTREVSLMEMGEILQSDELVMRVDLYDQQRRPYAVFGEPYFRGRALDEYSYVNGHARWERRSPFFGSNARVALNEAPADREIVRQEICLEPTNKRLLFAVHPVFRAADSPRQIRFDYKSQELFRQHADQYRQYRYALTTTAFKNGSQLPLLPASLFDGLELLQEPSITELDFPHVARLARQVLEENQALDANTILRARTLQNYLRNQGGFRFTLDFTHVRRTPEVDPIEDFVANHRSGHCEYFASALVLMLRSQGIPARMIVGYKGGEYNAVGGFYLIRERDAHAWVEAFVPRSELIDSTSPGISRHGAWLRLDPTPGATVATPEPNVLDTMGQALDYAQLLWADYVIGMDLQHQRTTMLQPVNLMLRLSEAESLLGRFALRMQEWAENLRWLVGGNWFSWRAGVAAMLICTLVWSVFHASACLARRWLTSWNQRQAGAAKRRCYTRVEFYQRLENVLARVDFFRSASQTQLEFATAAGQMIDPRVHREVVPLLRQVVDVFYQVRFGNMVLDEQQRRLVEQALERLEELVGSPEGRIP